MTQSFNQSLVQMVSSIVLLIGSIFMMFKTDWHLAVTAIVSVFAGFALSSIIMVKSQPLFKQQQDNLAKVSGYVEEIYSGHNVVISYNGRHQAKDHFDAINQDLYQSMWKSQFFSGIMMPLMQFVGNFGCHGLYRWGCPHHCGTLPSRDHCGLYDLCPHLYPTIGQMAQELPNCNQPVLL